MAARPFRVAPRFAGAMVTLAVALGGLACGTPQEGDRTSSLSPQLPVCPEDTMGNEQVTRERVASFCAGGFTDCRGLGGRVVPAALFCQPGVVPAPLPAPTTSAIAPVARTEPAPPPPLPQRGLARKDGGKIDALLAEADTAFVQGDFAAAEKKYKDAALKAPKDPAPIVGMVRARLGKANVSSEFAGAPKSPVLKAALVDLARARKLDEAYAPAALEIGRAHLVLGEAKEAEEALARAVELDATDPEAHSARGVAALALGNVEAAAKALGKSAELDPGSAERQGNLGTALLMLGKVDEAVLAYRRAHRIAPKNARMASDLGTALLQQGQLVEALPILEAAVQLDPGRATFRNNLGYALYLKGDLDGAEAQLAQAVRIDEKLISAWVNRANVAAKKKKLTDAWAHFDKVKAIDAKDPRVTALEAELKELSPR